MTDTLAPTALESYRLSPQQKRVWLSETAEGPLRAQCLIRIDGELRTDELQRALDQLVLRHEILRTVFPRRSGMTMPTQAIAGEPPILRIVDQWYSIDELLENELHRSFNLESGALLHAALHNVKATEHLLILTLPTICADSRSLAIIANELAGFYAGEDIALDEPIQYVQFSEWQNEMVATDDEHRQAGHEYWAAALSNLPGTPSLPFEVNSSSTVNRSTHDQHMGAIKVELGTDAQSSLNSLSQELEIPCAAILAAAWNSVIALWTGECDLAFRYTLDGRKFSDLNNAVGLYATQVPMRVGFEFSESLRHLALRTSEVVQDAAHFQEYYTGNPADGSEIGFSYENLTCDLPTGFRLLRSSCSLEPCKLRLACSHRQSEFSISLEYESVQFKPSDIERLADSYTILLHNALVEPEAPIGSLGFISRSEIERVTGGLNCAVSEYNLTASVHSLFEATAARQPESIALVCGNERLTYRELNARANQLARYLVKRGVEQGAIVGLCLDRSVDLVVGLLGILKTGGAYLPLDPTLPLQRIADMIEDSRATVVVTQSDYSHLFRPDVEQVVLDEQAKEIAGQCSDDLAIDVPGDNLVYVIYTSGSTGQPKGVAIEHRNLLNYILGVSERLELPRNGSYATVSTISADLGNTMIFPALCLGGCLHLVGAEDSTDSALWRGYLADHRIDCLKIVPSHLSALLGDSEDVASLLPRAVLILGGEACSWNLIDRIRQASPDLHIFNHYGPTETTVGVLTCEVTDAARDDCTTVPLGRPLPNSTAFVLNDFRQTVPAGVIGEIYIGGAGVGRGYINQSGLTAERFFETRLPQSSSHTTNRLYKTGDRARMLPDGNLEFLGRVDHQVKIRGYRIELGEIENALLRHPSVREAVVIAREDGDRGHSLAGYLVAAEGGVDIPEVRAYLQNVLPAYMIPTALVVLPRLPLNPNGKLDRNALPDPRTIEESADRARTEFEELLAGIWEDLLGIERVGVHQSFFELGGHSLLAMQLVSRIRETFKVEMPLRALFETATISGLTELIHDMQRAGEGLLMPPLQPAPSDRSLPLSFSQQRLWFIDQLQPNSHLYNVPRAFRIRGKLNLSALQQSLEQIVSRHEILRTNYRSDGGSTVQIVSPSTDFELPVIDLSKLAHDEAVQQARQLAREEATRAFTLSTDRLLRGSLLKLADDDHVLLMTTHHIASDGWSNGILAREVSSLYNAGGRNNLPDLPAQYADYAAWQRSWLTDQVLDSQIDYWCGKLSGAPPVIQLPTDRSRDSAETYDGALEHFRISVDLTAPLHKLCREEQVTQFMALLTVFKVLLYRWTGESDLVVGTDLANRNLKETERLIGFFLNHLVLRTDLSGDLSFWDVIRRVREVCLGAYAHQDLPFDKLVEVLQPERRGSHTPVFQVLFVVQDVPTGGLQLNGLECSDFSDSAPPSKFDLSLFLGELNGELVGTWVYRTDLFDKSTIQSLAAQFIALLTEMLANPERSIEDVELISPTACVRKGH